VDTKERVLEFFAARGGVPGETEAQRLATPYLDRGLLDSMEIVMMVAEFEEEFAIRFSADDLQAETFLTVGGLIETIEHARSRAAGA
jgi:acyl carrier protein